MTKITDINVFQRNLRRELLEDYMKISIVGFGYIGAVIGAVYADLGHSVHAIDSNVSSMNDLNQGICYVPEPALRELIKKG